jgi:hypothetical protein
MHLMKTYNVRLGIPSISWCNITLLVEDDSLLEQELVSKAIQIRKELMSEGLDDELEYDIEFIEATGYDYNIEEELIN